MASIIGSLNMRGSIRGLENLLKATQPENNRIGAVLTSLLFSLLLECLSEEILEKRIVLGPESQGLSVSEGQVDS